MTRIWTESECVRQGFFWACGLVGIMVVYALSIGPAAWLHHRVENPQAQTVIETLYGPVTWSINTCDPLRSVAYWYVGLWIDVE